jgi:hypothetical protein
MSSYERAAPNQIFVYDPGVSERATLELDAFENTFLSVARQVITTFDVPDTQCWMTAFMEAEAQFPRPFGATIAHTIVMIINVLRAQRSTTFSYFRHDDPLAKLSMTPEERYLVLTVRNVRRGNGFAARMNAMLACEGGDAHSLLGATERLGLITGDVMTLQYQT